MWQESDGRSSDAVSHDTRYKSQCSLVAGRRIGLGDFHSGNATDKESQPRQPHQPGPTARGWTWFFPTNYLVPNGHSKKTGIPYITGAAPFKYLNKQPSRACATASSKDTIPRCWG